MVKITLSLVDNGAILKAEETNDRDLAYERLLEIKGAFRGLNVGDLVRDLEEAIRPVLDRHSSR